MRSVAVLAQASFLFFFMPGQSMAASSSLSGAMADGEHSPPPPPVGSPPSGVSVPPRDPNACKIDRYTLVRLSGGPVNKRVHCLELHENGKVRLLSFPPLRCPSSGWHGWHNHERRAPLPMQFSLKLRFDGTPPLLQVRFYRLERLGPPTLATLRTDGGSR